MTGTALDRAGRHRQDFTVYERAGRVRRRKREVRAVDGIDLTVDAGSMVGYIGPNGAGKSTTIKMLIGILVPSRGIGAGRRPRPEPRPHRGRPPHRRGVRPAHPAVVGPARSPTRSSCCATCTGCPRPTTASTLGRMVELLDMGPFLATPVRQLSLGQRMRGELAAALLHGPAGALPRRADHRARRRLEGGGARASSPTCTASTARPCC